MCIEMQKVIMEVNIILGLEKEKEGKFMLSDNEIEIDEYENEEFNYFDRNIIKNNPICME